MQFHANVSYRTVLHPLKMLTFSWQAPWSYFRIHNKNNNEIKGISKFCRQKNGMYVPGMNQERTQKTRKYDTEHVYKKISAFSMKRTEAFRMRQKSLVFTWNWNHLSILITVKHWCLPLAWAGRAFVSYGFF